MRTVTIRLSGEDFATTIVGMRDWLEKHRCEPAAYRYDQDDDTVVVSVDFAIDAQATAFAEHFGGASGDRRLGATNGVGMSSDHSVNGAPANTPLEDLRYALPRSDEIHSNVAMSHPSEIDG